MALEIVGAIMWFCSFGREMSSKLRDRGHTQWDLAWKSTKVVGGLALVLGVSGLLLTSHSQLSGDVVNRQGLAEIVALNLVTVVGPEE